MFGYPVQYAEGSCYVCNSKRKYAAQDLTFAVIPCHTPAQARAICRAAPFLQMTEGERIRAIVSTIADDQRHDENTFLRSAFEADARAYLRARVVLRAMGLGGASK